MAMSNLISISLIDVPGFARLPRILFGEEAHDQNIPADFGRNLATAGTGSIFAASPLTLLSLAMFAAWKKKDFQLFKRPDKANSAKPRFLDSLHR